MDLLDEIKCAVYDVQMNYREEIYERVNGEWSYTTSFGDFSITERVLINQLDRKVNSRFATESLEFLSLKVPNRINKKMISRLYELALDRVKRGSARS